MPEWGTFVWTPKCCFPRLRSPFWYHSLQLPPKAFALSCRQCKLEVLLRVLHNFVWELLKGSKSGSIMCLFQSPLSMIVIWGMRMLNFPCCTSYGSCSILLDWKLKWRSIQIVWHFQQAWKQCFKIKQSSNLSPERQSVTLKATFLLFPNGIEILCVFSSFLLNSAFRCSHVIQLKYRGVCGCPNARLKHFRRSGLLWQ